MFHLTGGVAGLYLSQPEVNRVPFNRFRIEGFPSASVNLDSFTPYLALSAASKGVDHIPDHPSYSMYLDFGILIPISFGKLFEISLRENMSNEKGTSDIDFFFGIRL